VARLPATAEGLVSDEVIKDSARPLLSRFGGKTYRSGWYALPMIWIYNKDLYDKAGLDADQAPPTWDEFLAACDKLKWPGIAPLGRGIQDGLLGRMVFRPCDRSERRQRAAR
jgi:ABC-type glycerol-3-phosphate transport system substrate-binding protein